MTDKFVRGAMMDADMIRAHEAGDDLSRFPLYHAPGVPTYHGALILADMCDVEIIDTHTKATAMTNGKRAYTALVKVRRHTNSVYGAGMSQSQTVAIGLAFRAAVQHVVPLDMMESCRSIDWIQAEIFHLDHMNAGLPEGQWF